MNREQLKAILHERYGDLLNPYPIFLARPMPVRFEPVPRLPPLPPHEPSNPAYTIEARPFEVPLPKERP